MIWRSKDDASRSLNVFVRPMFTPYPDRNLVSASINAGLALKAPLPGRDSDTFGVEMGTAWASTGASGFDRQMQFFQPSVYTPVRGARPFIEATYQFQALPSWVRSSQTSIYFVNSRLQNANPDTHAADQKQFVVGLGRTCTSDPAFRPGASDANADSRSRAVGLVQLHAQLALPAASKRSCC